MNSVKKSQSLSAKKLKKIKLSAVEYSFILPAFLFLAVFILYPVIENFILSVKDVNISNIVRGGAEFVGLENYRQVFADPYFWRAFLNTAIFMVACLSLQFIIGMLMALFFNLKFAGAKWMRALVLVGWMNPIIITGSVFKWLLSGDSGVVNYLLMQIGIIKEPIMFLTEPGLSLASVTFANIWIGIPFNMILLLAGMQSLPEDIYEAASIDGAGKIASFFNITIPLLKPTISILLMMGVIYTFKVFDLIYMMTKGGPARSSQILPYYSYELSFQSYKYGKGAVVSVVVFLLVMIFAVFYLRASRKEGD